MLAPARGLDLLRVVLAALIAVHGWARLLNDAVEPFGAYLAGAGIPLGRWLAWAITAAEIGATPLLAAGWRARWLALGFIAIYAAGAWMVHRPAGWFVVGLGRNGLEYSVLLIVCLGLVAATSKGRA